MDIRSQKTESSPRDAEKSVTATPGWTDEKSGRDSVVRDSFGRTITLERCATLSVPIVDDLVEMYDEFDPPGIAHGLPPVGESRIRDWLDVLSAGFHAVARYRGRIVGHAVLVPTEESAHELAIFVHQDYRKAGIGTTVLTEVLKMARRRDVPTVRLYVERSNDAAIGLYRSFGFEAEPSGPGELEMRLALDGESTDPLGSSGSSP